MSSQPDIDPALERRLRRTFRAVAETVDDGPFVRGGIALEPTRPVPAGPGRRQMAALSVALVVALGVGFVLGARSGSQVATAPTTPTDVTDPSTAEVVETAAAVAVEQVVLDAGADAAVAGRCAHEAADRAEMSDVMRILPVPTPADIVDEARLQLPATDQRAAREVIVATTDSTLMVCEVEVGSDAAADYQLTPLVSAAPGAHDLHIEHSSWYSPTDDGLTGPGWASVLGRAGEDVASIELVAPDGATAVAAVDGGWFYARVDVAADVRLFDERVRWTAEDGTHETRADLLDSDTPAETCARQGDQCIEQRVAELAADAELLADTGAAEVVEDGRVTSDEWLRAREAYALCMRTHGVQVSVAGDGLAISTPATPDGGWMAPSVPTCDGPFSLVGEVRDLRDAQQRLAEG